MLYTLNPSWFGRFWVVLEYKYHPYKKKRKNVSHEIPWKNFMSFPWFFFCPMNSPISIHQVSKKYSEYGPKHPQKTLMIPPKVFLKLSRSLGDVFFFFMNFLQDSHVTLRNSDFWKYEKMILKIVCLEKITF